MFSVHDAAKESGMTQLSEKDKAYLVRERTAAVTDALSPHASAILTRLLLKQSMVDVTLNGARCWLHRDEKDEIKCEMSVVPGKEEKKEGRRWLVLHHDHVSWVTEPFVQCNEAAYAKRVRHGSAKQYNAITHSCSAFPEDKGKQAKWWRVGLSNAMTVREQVRDVDGQITTYRRPLFRVSDGHLITLRALIELNKSVFCAYQGTPQKLLALLIKRYSDELCDVRERHPALTRTICSDTMLDRFAKQLVMNKNNATSLFRTLWHRQWLTSVRMLTACCILCGIQTALRGIADDLTKLVTRVNTVELQVDCTYKAFHAVKGRADYRVLSAEANARTTVEPKVPPAGWPVREARDEECEKECEKECEDESDSETEPRLLADEEEKKEPRAGTIRGDWKQRTHLSSMSMCQLVISNELELVYSVLPVNGTQMMH